jgi:hypothetical protein
MGKIHTQLSLEEQTRIHTQLEMGLKPLAIAMGLNRSARRCLADSIETAGLDQNSSRRVPVPPFEMYAVDRDLLEVKVGGSGVRYTGVSFPYPAS